MVDFSFFFLHFLLFVLYPRQRGNLYFSLFLLVQVLTNFFSVPILFFHYGTVIYYWCYYLSFLTGMFSAVPMLAFLYTDFEGRIPRINWVFFGYIFLIGIGFFFYRNQIFSSLYSILNIYFAIECTRIMVQAIRRRRQDAWIVGIGIFLIDVLILREIIIGFGIVEIPVSIYYISDVLGLYGLLVSLTIYLARQFARTSTNLDAQLVKQVEHERAASQLALEREQEKARFALVEAENERRAQGIGRSPTTSAFDAAEKTARYSKFGNRGVYETRDRSRRRLLRFSRWRGWNFDGCRRRRDRTRTQSRNGRYGHQKFVSMPSHRTQIFRRDFQAHQRRVKKHESARIVYGDDAAQNQRTIKSV